jgi:hypothetical protein
MNLGILTFGEFGEEKSDKDQYTKNKDILEDGAHVEPPLTDEDKVGDHQHDADEEIDDPRFWAESCPASPAGDDTVPDLCE